jgi:hypothetical protein
LAIEDGPGPDSVLGWRPIKGGPSPPGSSGDISPSDDTPPHSPQQEVVFTQVSKTYTAKQLSAGVFVLDGSTVSAGGSPITINGAIVSGIDSRLVIQTDSASGRTASSGFDKDETGDYLPSGGNSGGADALAVPYKGKAKKNGSISVRLEMSFGMILCWVAVMFVVQ